MLTLVSNLGKTSLGVALKETRQKLTGNDDVDADVRRNAAWYNSRLVYDRITNGHDLDL